MPPSSPISLETWVNALSMAAGSWIGMTASWLTPTKPFIAA